MPVQRTTYPYDETQQGDPNNPNNQNNPTAPSAITENFGVSMAKNAFKEIPVPLPNAASITALQKSGGRVIGYQLSNGTVVDKQQAVNLARSGQIKGVGISQRSGNEYLKSIPDQTESDNLSSLPTIK